MKEFLEIFKRRIKENTIMLLIIFVFCVAFLAILIAPPYFLGYVIPVDREVLGILWGVILLASFFIWVSLQEGQSFWHTLVKIISCFILFAGVLIVPSVIINSILMFVDLSDEIIFTIVIGIVVIYLSILCSIHDAYEEWVKRR